jgi:hypothetical protein
VAVDGDDDHRTDGRGEHQQRDDRALGVRNGGDRGGGEDEEQNGASGGVQVQADGRHGGALLGKRHAGPMQRGTARKRCLNF